VRRSTRAEWALLAAAGTMGTAALAVLLDRFTDSAVPFWDALTTALSLAATYGQCRKLVESWWLWIAADLVYIPLYAYKGLFLTSLLYAGFVALCVGGLRGWRSDLGATAAPAAGAAA
jgi:nicotinamide mononucleotide transporter